MSDTIGARVVPIEAAAATAATAAAAAPSLPPLSAPPLGSGSFGARSGSASGSSGRSGGRLVCTPSGAPLCASGDVDAIIDTAAMQAASAAAASHTVAAAARAEAAGFVVPIRDAGPGGPGAGSAAGGGAAAVAAAEFDAVFGAGDGAPTLAALFGGQAGADRSLDSLSLPSMQDPDGWAELLRDLRRWSSNTSRSNPSFNATDWIPDIIGRVDEDEEAAAATAAAADGTAGGAALAAQRAKRERSGGYNTRAHQQLLAQATVNDDSFSADTLRAMLRGDHAGSMGRHMPALRIGSAQNDAAARAAAMAGRVTPHDKSGPGGGAARG
ncbi:hypothetical protein MNEG_8389 [Monoraphidium neglectum]|uniref:Uncharacterized protein n=1 Tax=Monoraphidium neglectum TaxID=145388 RepID=A0A0D2MFV8_9CHLO|nr:hypothetical protein MNEG_8389 [Monoraphidium neglectum]KIY99571.1 hypothetical protein MNEG_8389 [Monoraphidium neglectum]|eukprot:XP_013898591.1 hypothetical protein MNEG_8389 [Monoraphidium neglectum]